MSIIQQLLIILYVCLGEASLLYPYGSKHGDVLASSETLHPGIDDVSLNVPLMVYGKSHSTLKICGNYGTITWKSYCQSDMFPSLNQNDGSVSPFLVRQNVTEYGVWYRTTKQRKLLKKAAADIRKSFKRCVGKFKPKQLTVVTWLKSQDYDRCEDHYMLKDPKWCECLLGFSVDAGGQTIWNYLKDIICDCAVRRGLEYDVCAASAWYNRRIYLWREYEQARREYWQNHNYTDPNPPKREENTYQAVLMTDGRKTFVMFNYDQLDWYYTNADTLNGFVRYNALVGISGEDSNGCMRYYSHPASGTNATLDLAKTTNCGVPGRWLYQVDSEPVAAGCEKLELYHHMRICSKKFSSKRLARRRITKMK